MNQQPDPLVMLKDIHLPEPISWWPLAPGWWVLLVLVATGIAVGVYLLQKRIAANRYRRAALNELKKQFADYRDHGQQPQLCQQVLATLRRCLVTTGTSATHYSASELLAVLNQQAGNELFNEALASHMDELNYAQSPAPLNESDLAQFRTGATQWIKRHNRGKKRRKNTREQVTP